MGSQLLCCLHLLEDGGRGRPATPCTLPSQSTFTQSYAWLTYTGRTTRTMVARRALVLGYHGTMKRVDASSSRSLSTARAVEIARGTAYSPPPHPRP